MEFPVKKKLLLPARSYGGLARELDALPSIALLKLFHADESSKGAQIEFINTYIEHRRNALYSADDWRELARLKLALQNQMRRTNRAIVEMRPFSFRFKVLIQEYTQQQTHLVSQIKEVTEEIQRSKEIEKEMASYIKTHAEKFPLFLDRIVDISPDFSSVQDVLNRFETLEYYGHECSRMLEEEMEQVLESKREMIRVVDEKSGVFKRLYNSFVMLRVREKEAKERFIHWDRTVQKMRVRVRKETEEYLILEDGCYNLYRSMCSRRRVTPSAKVGDVEAQLNFIQETIKFYKDVFRIAATVRHDQAATRILKSRGQTRKKTTLISSILQT